MATTYLQKLRLFSRDARLVLVAGALIGFCTQGIYVVLFNLYLLRLGYGPEFIGLASAAGALALAVCSLPAGALGRCWGVRRVMIAGASLMVLGLGLLPLAEFMPDTFQPTWLVATNALRWLGGAAFVVNVSPFMMGASGEEERDHVFSVFLALLPLGGFVGSMIAGLLPGLFATTLGASLDQPAPYRYPLLIAAALLIPGVLALLATRKVVTGGPEAIAGEASPLPFGLIALVALTYLLRSAGEGVVMTFFNVYMDAGLHASTALIGTVMALGGLLCVPATLATPLAIARWGKGRTVVLGFCGMALSLLPLALIPHWIAAGLGFAGFLAGLGFISPAFFVFSQEAVSPGWRPAMSGATSMARGVSASALALGGGYAITALGYRSPFLIAAALSAAGAPLFWAFFLRRPLGELARDAAAANTEKGR